MARDHLRMHVFIVSWFPRSWDYREKKHLLIGSFLLSYESYYCLRIYCLPHRLHSPLHNPYNPSVTFGNVAFKVRVCGSIPWVPEVCLARFPVSVNRQCLYCDLLRRSLVGLWLTSAGKSRSGPRETSGTQGSGSTNDNSTVQNFRGEGGGHF